MSTKEDRIEMAIQVQKNLEKVNENDKCLKYDLTKSKHVRWCDRDGHDHEIVVLPVEDYSGVGVYVYTDGLNTARMGLSTKAALYLMQGIEEVIVKDKEFLRVLKEKNNEQVL